MKNLAIGQGEPLPDDAIFQGQWILRGELFLAVGHADMSPRSLATPIIQIPDGPAAFGIHAHHLGNALGVTHDEIMTANQDHSLWLIRVQPGVREGKPATMFEFRLGNRIADITMWKNMGSARAAS